MKDGENPPPHSRQLLRICGLAAVAALFERDPRRVERLFFEDRVKGEVGSFCRTLARARKPYRQLDKAELSRVAGTPLRPRAVAQRGRGGGNPAPSADPPLMRGAVTQRRVRRPPPTTATSRRICRD